MDDKLKFIQQNSPDGGFLQSEEWREFQEATGKKTFHIESENFWANIIEHELPIVGRYFYIPRGPIIGEEEQTNSEQKMEEIIALAKREGAGWIRIDEKNGYDGIKAPHDMQPQEIFIIDLTKSEEQLLAEMKPKTRYNIKLAEKKNVEVLVYDKKTAGKNLDKFYSLVEITAERQGVNFHAKEYYEKMLETIPAENLKLYCAEYGGQIVAANIMVFYGDTVTYLHGASDDRSRNVMAPYLLQWRQIQDAKGSGATRYDFGGVKINSKENKWAGLTRFKLSFSPSTEPIEFSGSYDIVVNPMKYYMYRIIQKVKSYL